MFHGVLLILLIWLVPVEPRIRSTPVNRVTKNVGIVFAPVASGNAVQPDESNLSQQQPAKHSTSDTSVAAIVSRHFPELIPPQPVTPLPVIGHSLPDTTTGFPTANNFVSGGLADGGSMATNHGVISGSFMGAKGTGRKFVYVLDRSASTGFGQRRSPLYVARKALLASLQSIGEAGLRESKPIQFQVVFFNHETVVFNTVGFGGSERSGRLLRYDQAAFDKLQRFLGGIIPDGGTKPEPALLEAIRMGADCIFFMTDGGTQLNQLQMQRIRQAAKGVQINVVEYGVGSRPARNSNLRQLADENHGNHVYVDLSQRTW